MTAVKGEKTNGKAGLESTLVALLSMQDHNLQFDDTAAGTEL